MVHHEIAAERDVALAFLAGEATDHHAAGVVRVLLDRV
jgi:hypothetical protein